MRKLLKALLVVLLGTIGICIAIWLLSTTTSNPQQAGVIFGELVIAVFLIASGVALFKRFNQK